MYSEDDLLPISALQHLAFCPRQWGLIHLEGVWTENRLTAEGRNLHERVHQAESEARVDVRIVRSLRLRSLRLGLVGMADVVEFHRAETGVTLPSVSGFWRPIPVEYKRGRPKPDRCDAVQLCAQALCLEEMLSLSIPAGLLFYGQPRRRTEVAFDGSLRVETSALAGRLHELTRAGVTPPAVYEKKCQSCSLLASCLPKAARPGRSVGRYLQRACRWSGPTEEPT